MIHGIKVPRISLSNKGPEFSRLVGGTWRLVQQAQAVPQRVNAYVDDCLDLGITTFDHADVYGNHRCEELFGTVLKQRPDVRDRIELVTKCGVAPISTMRPEHRLLHYNASARHIIDSVNSSLRSLNTEWLDLLLIHRPDPLMDADEVARAFDTLRVAGKVKYFGTSNFSVAQFELLQSRLNFKLVTNQLEVSVVETKAMHDGTLDHCQLHRIAVMAWSPLGGGRALAPNDEPGLALQNVLSEIAAKHEGADVAAITLAWLLQHPARLVPVLGTIDRGRLCRAAFAPSIQLDRQDWFSIYVAAGNRVV